MRSILVVIAMVFVARADGSMAETLHVPEQFGTIQAAIDVAVDGDVVEIADGRYTGDGNKNLDYGGRAIAVRSASGDPALCIVDCEGEGRGVSFHSGEGRDSIFQGLTITNGLVSTGGGGIDCSDFSSPTIIDCVITVNSTGRSGGGISCTNHSSPLIENCTISDNSIHYRGGGGGGVFCGDHSSPTLAHCTIIGNDASSYRDGGGMYCSSESSPMLTGCTIEGNTARDGGGIYSSSKSSPTLTGCTIVGNTAEQGDGGGIYSSSKSSPTLTECTILGNTAGDGGGIYCHFGGGFTLTNCTIDANGAPGSSHGGGIYSRSDERQVLIGCSIDDNAARVGGGLYLTGSAPRLINCSINRNTAARGGGIWCELGSKPTLSNCSINENDADGHGGGVLCRGESSPTLRNCTINHNSAGVGGGLNCDDHSAPKLIDCEVSGNFAEYYGGILCSGSSPKFTNCSISGNSSVEPGGGIFIRDHSSPQLTNCRITGNTAKAGGGVFCVNNSHPVLTNCTISGNVADTDGGGFYCQLDSTPTITNTVLWGNAPQEIFVHSGNPIITYCNVRGGWDGPGNIDSDPLFVDPDGPDDDLATWQDNDFRLFPGSPCIDAADNEAVPEGVNGDLNGDPRFVDDPATEDTGNGVPPIVDMGPYEFEIRLPAPPGELLASDGDHEYRVAVTWERAFPADEYQVYRNVENDPEGSEAVSDWQTATEFDDHTAEHAQVYWYWVVARNDKGESGWSDGDSGFRWEGPPLPPANVQATDGDHEEYVVVSWEPSITGEEYRVHRHIENDPDNSEWHSVWMTETRRYRDRFGDPRRVYWYWVTARNENGESDWGEGDTGHRTCNHDPEWICDGDVDGNGQVNAVDLSIVEANFGNANPTALCNYDLDCDGQINPVDGGIVRSLFGTCEAPRGVCP